MVIVIPLQATDVLIQLAQTYTLSLPVPLSSGCESYLSSDEMDTIFDMLSPFRDKDEAVTHLLRDLQDYANQNKPVVPCSD